MLRFGTALISACLIGLTACVTPPAQDMPDPTPRQKQLMAALAEYSGSYDVSAPALRTARRDEDGRPIGVNAYDEPDDAIQAGDMAAFLTILKLKALRDGTTTPNSAVMLSLDAAGKGDMPSALRTLKPALDVTPPSQLARFLEAWYLALDGKGEDALAAHRALSRQLPGLTGDLSLATLLEALERHDEALAVYSAMMPSQIIAPEHDFDPQGLVYSHIQLVVARHALLLRREGQIEAAQALYQRLADADPEQAVVYKAAIDGLASGRGMPEAEDLDLRNGFARALHDYTLAVHYQNLFDVAVVGARLRGYNSWGGALDQMALLIAPENDTLRLNVFDDLYKDALYDGALNVLQAAPAPSADLKTAEANTLLRLDRPDDARAALDQALTLGTPDRLLSISTSALRLYALLNEEESALRLAAELPDLAETDAERAFAHGTSYFVFRQFGVLDAALRHARDARDLDDTHAHRLLLANALAEAGQVERGLSLLRNEALGRPNDPYMLNTLGYYLVIHTDRLEEAFKVLARAVALAPGNSYIADSFGWVRYKLGDLEGARFYIELSRRELAPNRNWEIEDHLGDVYWHLGLTEEARMAWRNALDEFPPDADRSLIEDKLENGLKGPPPEKQPLPDVSLSDDGEIDRQEFDPLDIVRLPNMTDFAFPARRLAKLLLVGVSLGLGACVSPSGLATPDPGLDQVEAETRIRLEARDFARFTVARYASLTDDPQTASAAYGQISQRQMQDPVIADRAIFSTLLVGQVAEANTLALTLPLSSLKASDLARLTLAIDAIAKGQDDRALSLLATSWRSQFHASLADTIKAWLVFEQAPTAGIQRQANAGGDNPVLRQIGKTLAARMKADTGDQAGAMADFAELWTDRAGTAIGVETEARLMARAGQPDAALDRLRAFRETVGRHPALSALAADIETGQVAPPAALGSRQGMALYIYAAAAALSQQQASDVAAVYFALALHLDPELDSARTLWADALDRGGRRPEAIRLLRGIAADSPYHISTQGQLAWILLREGREADALELVRTTLARTDDRNIRIQYGDLLRSTGRLGQAIEVISQVIDADAARGVYDWRLYFARGAAREQLGYWAPAESDLETALGLNPDNPDLLNYLGYSWINRGIRLERGLALIERALVRAPDNGAITDSLGWAYYKLGQYDRAVYHLERATELLPRAASILDHLGDAYWQTGRYTEAGYQWQRAMDLADSDTARAAYAAKLAVEPARWSPPLRQPQPDRP